MSKTKVFPEYLAVRARDMPGWLIVTCPREDCGEEFLVKAAAWRRRHAYTTHKGQEHVVVGRSCPYCFAAARMPARISRSSG
jgi:hypothetical protein